MKRIHWKSLAIGGFSVSAISDDICWCARHSVGNRTQRPGTSGYQREGCEHDLLWEETFIAWWICANSFGIQATTGLYRYVQCRLHTSRYTKFTGAGHFGNACRRKQFVGTEIPKMLCSGGGGRVDYGALKYFTEFWPSDNTDPLERIFIQWEYSYFYPAIASSNHVTAWVNSRWNSAPM